MDSDHPDDEATGPSAEALDVLAPNFVHGCGLAARATPSVPQPEADEPTSR